MEPTVQPKVETRGRPKTGRVKGMLLQVSVTAEEKKQVRQHVKGLGLTVTDYIRNFLFPAVKPKEPIDPFPLTLNGKIHIIEKEEAKRLFKQLSQKLL
jgi:antitoxin component of RelBE/YafQ-DinJ toxin-antitoxin module